VILLTATDFRYFGALPPKPMSQVLEASGIQRLIRWLGNGAASCSTFQVTRMTCSCTAPDLREARKEYLAQSLYQASCCVTTSERGRVVVLHSCKPGRKTRQGLPGLCLRRHQQSFLTECLGRSCNPSTIKLELFVYICFHNCDPPQPSRRKKRRHRSGARKPQFSRHVCFLQDLIDLF